MSATTRPQLLLLVAAVTIVFLSRALPAAEFNEVLDLGDPAPSWTDLPGTDGAKHSLADLKETPLAVVAFTCNKCPVAADYDERIAELARRYHGKVAFVAINSNRGREETLEKTRSRLGTKTPFPYLRDESQQVARSYGARATPQFFLLSAERKVVYMGALDDNSNPQLAKQHYLADAIEAVLNGREPTVKETFAHGCGIRYPRKRD